MHGSSMERMREFAAKLGPAQGRTVLDVGAMDICGSYREIFEPLGFVYKGLDQEAGRNVDLVEKAFPWSLTDDSFDIVISGQALEHVERPTHFMLQLAKVLKRGGRMCVIVPHAWGYHRCPIDCWRIFDDGMRVLLNDVQLQIDECFMKEADTPGYGDTIAYATKPAQWNCSVVCDALMAPLRKMRI